MDNAQLVITINSNILSLAEYVVEAGLHSYDRPSPNSKKGCRRTDWRRRVFGYYGAITVTGA